MKTKEIVGCEIPLFDRSVMAVVGCTEAEGVTLFSNYAKERGADGIAFELTNGRGYCASAGGDIYIWLEDENKSSLFIHEMVHAAFQLCDAIGAVPDQEIIARLVEYMKIHLMDEIYYDAKETCTPEGMGIVCNVGDKVIDETSMGPPRTPTECKAYDEIVRETAVATREFLDRAKEFCDPQTMRVGRIEAGEEMDGRDFAAYEDAIILPRDSIYPPEDELTKMLKEKARLTQ